MNQVTFRMFYAVGFQSVPAEQADELLMKFEVSGDYALFQSVPAQQADELEEDIRVLLSR